MADLPSPRSPDDPAGQSTRQLLEELDDLMQRMLALPVQQGDEEPAPEQPAAVKAIAPTAAPTPDVPNKKSIKGSDLGHRTSDAGPKGVHLLHVPAMRVTVQAPVTGQPAQDVAATVGQATRPKPAERTPPPYRDKVLDEDPAPTYLPVGAEPLLPILLQHPSKAATKSAAAAAPASAPRETRAGKPPAAPRPSWMPTPSASAPAAQGSFGWLLTINENFDTCTRLLGPAGRWLRGEQGRSIVGWTGLAMIAAALIWAAILFLG